MIIVLKQMHPNKAPGPDGMAPLFFITYWDIVGQAVTKVVLSSFKSGTLPPILNHSFITLISKKKRPKFVTDFWPISLSNVLYKLVAKVLANRLKGILHQIISPTQSAFVLGRRISNNVLATFEIMHFLNQKRGGKENFMFLKLDISKAYDRVKWNFIEQAMIKIGSVSFAVLINGELSIHIQPSKCIHQGDPLFPYLFLLCTEDLITLLSKAVESH